MVARTKKDDTAAQESGDAIESHASNETSEETKAAEEDVVKVAVVDAPAVNSDVEGQNDEAVKVEVIEEVKDAEGFIESLPEGVEHVVGAAVGQIRQVNTS